MAPPRRKKQKHTREFGAPLGDEEGEDRTTAQSEADVQALTSWSNRVVPLSAADIPSLSTLCMQAFAGGFAKLGSDEESARTMKEWLQAVPDNYIPRLMTCLKEAGIHPAKEFVNTYLLRGQAITLDDNMPQIDVTAIRRRPETCRNLRELHLKNLPGVSDRDVALVVEKLPALRVLVLRGCTKIGEKTAAAVALSCPNLLVLNLNYTSVLPAALAAVLRACKSLEVLKVAGISSWTPANIAKLFTSLDSAEDSEFVLPALRSLKLKQLGINDQALGQFLKICPNLRRLDVSFTAIRRPPLLLSNTSLEKLSLTSTGVSGADLIKIVSGMTALHTLAMGGLGRGGSSAVAMASTLSLTLSDDVLAKLTNVLVGYSRLAHVNLAGNTKLGMVTRSSLTDFIERVGRRCQTLNLGGVSSLRSSQLEGLLALDDEQDSSPLQVLVLNNTDVDDAAAPWLASCAELRILEVAGTKFTSDGLCEVLDGCRKLERLNLTSCRRIELASRRNFFATFEEWQRGRLARGGEQEAM